MSFAEKRRSGQRPALQETVIQLDGVADAPQTSPPPLGLQRRSHEQIAAALSSDIGRLSSQLVEMRALIEGSERGARGGAAAEELDGRAKLQGFMEQIQRRVRVCNDNLKELASSEASLPAAQRAAVDAKLKTDFETVLLQFSALSSRAAAQSRDYVARVTAVQRQFHKHPDEPEVVHAQAESAPLLSADEAPEGHVMQTQMFDDSVRHNDLLIAERNADIRDIERSINEVNEIFRDLGTMIHEQQFLLDHIENNVTGLVDNTENANAELLRAQRYQSRLRRWKMWCFCILFVIVLVLLLILFIAW